MASEILPLQSFTVMLTERPEGEESSNMFQLYHKKTLYYTFRADDQHTARRSGYTHTHTGRHTYTSTIFMLFTFVLQVGQCHGGGHSVITPACLHRPTLPVHRLSTHSLFPGVFCAKPSLTRLPSTGRRAYMQTMCGENIQEWASLRWKPLSRVQCILRLGQFQTHCRTLFGSAVANRTLKKDETLVARPIKCLGA